MAARVADQQRVERQCENHRTWSDFVLQFQDRLQGRRGDGDEHVRAGREAGIHQTREEREVALGIADGQGIIAPLPQARCCQAGQDACARFFHRRRVHLLQQADFPRLDRRAGQDVGPGQERIVQAKSEAPGRLRLQRHLADGNIADRDGGGCGAAQDLRGRGGGGKT